MKNKAYLCLLALILFTGCASLKQEKQKSEPQLSPLELKINRADGLLKQKNYQQAFMLYAEAQKEAKDEKVFRELQLKISATQFEMNNFPAAMAALAPMPEFPATLNDCKKLVMAARILQKMNGKPEHIEALLEVALDNSINEPGTVPFKASGYAELGKVYVANKKTPRAVKCFEYATKLYKIVGDEENAAICKNIMEYLQ